MNSTLGILNHLLSTGVDVPVVRLSHGKNTTAKILRGGRPIAPIAQTPDGFVETLEGLVEKATQIAVKARN